MLSPKRQGIQTRRNIVDFVERFIENRRYPPSIREIQAGCEISSTSVVAHHLDILEEDGVITREPRTSRTIQIVGDLNE